MNEFAKRIEKNIRKGKKVSGTKVFEDIIFILLKETSMTLGDIVSAPTPLIMSINEHVTDYLQKVNKKR